MAIVTINDDLKSVTITYDHATPVFFVENSTAQVEGLLKALGLARSAILPEIPKSWTSSQTNAMRDPKLFLEIESLNGDPVLRIRHPHFGWLHFVFSRNEAAGLGQALIERANADPPAPAGRA